MRGGLGSDIRACARSLIRSTRASAPCRLSALWRQPQTTRRDLRFLDDEGYRRLRRDQPAVAGLSERSRVAPAGYGRRHVRNESERHLLAAVELAGRSRAKGNHPFGALLVDADGKVVLEGENTVLTAQDCTGHAETNLMRVASKRFDPEFLSRCTLHTTPSRARCARERSTGATYAASCLP
jgi:hypothetical protein